MGVLYQTQGTDWRISGIGSIIDAMINTLFWLAMTALATVVVALIAIYQAYLFRVSIRRRYSPEDGAAVREQGIRRYQKRGREGFEKISGKSLATEDRKNLERILSFFETLGLLVHQRAINKELAWNSFFHHFYGYCAARGNRYIAAQREKFGTRYTEILLVTE